MTDNLPWEWFEVSGTPNELSSVLIGVYDKNGKYYVIPESKARELWEERYIINEGTKLAIKELREENACLRKALEHYASPDLYVSIHDESWDYVMCGFRSVLPLDFKASINYTGYGPWKIAQEALNEKSTKGAQETKRSEVDDDK